MRKSSAAGVLAAFMLVVMTSGGAALAGGGNGNGNGNGHDSGSWAGGDSSGQVSSADSSHGSSQAQEQQQQAAPQQSSHDQSRGSSKHESQPAAPSTTAQANDQGIKPSNHTDKNTEERADSSKTKQYGNGLTAGKIATSRGAPGDTKLRGPGNSQPHKVCRDGHWVDVHAVKSYSGDSNSCGEKSAVAGVSHEQKHEQSKSEAAPQVKTTCARSVTVTVPAGVWHHSGSGWEHTGSKHDEHEGDIAVSQSTTKTILVADACNKSAAEVQEIALQQAVPKCGHHVHVQVQEQQRPAAAVLPASHEEKKVYICHATGSATNPYVLIHVSKNALPAHTRHQDERDIVLGETLNGTCPAAPAATPAATAPQAAQLCTTTQQVQVVLGVKHFVGPKGSGNFVVIHPNEHSAHFTGKHEDDQVMYETRTITVPAECPATPAAPAAPAAVQTPAAPPEQTPAPVAATPPAVTPAAVTPAAPATQAPATPAATPAGGVAGAATPLTQQPASSASQPAAAPQSGVLGARATLTPATKPRSGVLGRVASSQLPFTGIELWIAVLVAGGLVAGGYAVRRAARGY